MPITEISVLRLLAPHSLETPPVPRLLQALAARQSSWSAYPLSFFVNVFDPPTLYVVTGWHDIRRQQEWVSSDGCADLMREAAPFLRPQRALFLDLDFDDIPRGCRGLVVGRLSTLSRLVLANGAGDGNEDGEAAPNGSGAGPAAAQRALLRPWIAVGRDIRSGVLYRLSACEGPTLEAFEARGQHQAGDDEGMRRITLPRA